MKSTAETFSAYVAARQAALLRTAYLITGDRHAAEDLVQIALSKTFLAWGRIKDARAVDAYVRRAMVNEHASWWRRAWRRYERPMETLPEPPAVDGPDRDAYDLVWNLVRGLPPRQRAAVVLRYYEERSEAETAEILGCSVGTVKSQTSRAIAALRRRLETDGADPSIAPQGSTS